MPRQSKHNHKAIHNRIRLKSRATKLLAQPRTSATLAELGEIVRCHIEPKFRQEEPILAQCCWVEYGYLSALERTIRFTETYATVYQNFWRKYRDYRTAEDQHPTTREWGGNDPSEMTAFWRARQTADRLGMPYDEFLSESFEFMIQKEGHKKYPRPNQLYDTRVLSHIEGIWKVRKGRVRIEDDWDPRFQITNYAGDPIQDRAHAMIIDQIRGAGSSSLRDEIRWKVVSYPVLPLVVAQKHFGDAVVAEALEHISAPLPPQPPATNTPRYIQSCLGVAYDMQPTLCVSCPVRKSCAALSSLIDQRCMQKFDDPEPKVSKDRLQARERQRKCRARKRDRQAMQLQAA